MAERIPVRLSRRRLPNAPGRAGAITSRLRRQRDLNWKVCRTACVSQVKTS